MMSRVSASPAIKSQQGSQTISQIRSSLVWDTRDNPLLTRTGHRVVFTPYIAGGFLGGDTQIYGWDIEGVTISSTLEGYDLTLQRGSGGGRSLGKS